MIHILKTEAHASSRQEQSIQTNKEAGQVVIEFLLSFVFVIGFILLFVRAALNSVDGYLVHYATFMASRTYLVSDDNAADPAISDPVAQSEATAAFNRYNLSAFLPNSRKLKINFNSVTDDQQRRIFTGAFATFQQPFSFSTVMGGSQPMNMISESFLGREPTRAICVQRICDAMKAVGKNDGHCKKAVDFNTTYFDDGC